MFSRAARLAPAPSASAARWPSKTVAVNALLSVTPSPENSKERVLALASDIWLPTATRQIKS